MLFFWLVSICFHVCVFFINKAIVWMHHGNCRRWQKNELSYLHLLWVLMTKIVFFTWKWESSCVNSSLSGYLSHALGTHSVNSVIQWAAHSKLKNELSTSANTVTRKLQVSAVWATSSSVHSTTNWCLARPLDGHFKAIVEVNGDWARWSQHSSWEAKILILPIFVKESPYLGLSGFLIHHSGGDFTTAFCPSSLNRKNRHAGGCSWHRRYYHWHLQKAKGEVSRL